MCFTKYYRNFILCGDLDHNCLLCDETFNDFDDIDKHVRWENHRKIVKTLTVLPQFKNDGIFKIEKYYYCQYCNHVYYNVASIKEHITSVKHTTAKTTPDVGSNENKKLEAYYDESGSVVINKIKIDNNCWNGIYNGKCLLCNKRVTNIAKHIDDQGHVIRLIQTITVYEGNDKCYRKINETTIQCFKCMDTFTFEDYDKHWQHHQLDINNNSGKPVRILTWSEYRKLNDQEFDIQKLANITDEYYNIDLKNKEIICKQCNSAVRNTKTDIHSHMFKHNIYKSSKIIETISAEIDKRYYFIEERDNGKMRHELATFGKDNHIKLDAGAHKGYCQLCDRFLLPRIEIFEEHVAGINHQGHLELKGLTKPKKQRKKGLAKMENFTRYIVTLDFIIDLESVAVNYSCCVDRQSFLLLKRIKHGKHMRVTKCLVCEESFKWWKEKEHCESSMHKSHFMAAKVMCADGNFIREIKPKMYHCGLCNVTLPFWDSLERHARDRPHKAVVPNKRYASNIKQFQEKHGHQPETKKIEHSNVNDVLYANMMKVLFESRLDSLRIYSIDLSKAE